MAGGSSSPTHVRADGAARGHRRRASVRTRRRATSTCVRTRCCWTSRITSVTCKYEVILQAAPSWLLRCEYSRDDQLCTHRCRAGRMPLLNTNMTYANCFVLSHPAGCANVMELKSELSYWISTDLSVNNKYCLFLFTEAWYGTFAFQSATCS